MGCSRKGRKRQGSTLACSPKGSGEPETVGDGRGGPIFDEGVAFSTHVFDEGVAFLVPQGESNRRFLLKGTHFGRTFAQRVSIFAPQMLPRATLSGHPPTPRSTHGRQPVRSAAEIGSTFVEIVDSATVSAGSEARRLGGSEARRLRVLNNSN